MACCDNIKTEKYFVKKGERLFQLVAANCSEIHFEIKDELMKAQEEMTGLEVLANKYVFLS